MTQPRSEQMKVIIRTPGRRRGPLQVQRDVAEIKDQVEDIQIGHSDFATWPPGMRRNPDAPPDFEVTPEITAGVGSFFVEWVTGESEFETTYEIHVDTQEGFTPAADTLAHEVTFSGIPGQGPAHMVKDFPEGHKLFGTAADPTNADTTYFVQIVPANAFGAALGPYPEASVTPLKVIGQMIEDATIDLAQHVQGLLPEANLEGITDPATLADGILTAAKIAVGGLDDSSKFGAGVIVGNLIAADTIASTHLATGSVVAGKIATNAIAAANIQAGAVIADKLAANSVVAGKVAANAVTAGNIDVSQLSAIAADIGSITAGTITGVSYLTASSGRRIRMGPVAADRDRVEFLSSGGTVQASISLTSGNDLVVGGLGTTLIRSFAPLRVLANDGVLGDPLRSYIELSSTGGAPSTPASGFARIFYNEAAGTNGQLRVINNNSNQLLASF